MDEETKTDYTITIGDKTYTTAGEVMSVTPTFDTSYVSDTGGEFTININEWQNDAVVYEDVVFADSMPSVHRVEAMCKEYPALAKAYEQFKLIYKMTEQDYKGKLKEEGLDDEIPF